MYDPVIPIGILHCVCTTQNGVSFRHHLPSPHTLKYRLLPLSLNEDPGQRHVDGTKDAHPETSLNHNW